MTSILPATLRHALDCCRILFLNQRTNGERMVEFWLNLLVEFQSCRNCYSVIHVDSDACSGLDKISYLSASIVRAQALLVRKCNAFAR